MNSKDIPVILILLFSSMMIMIGPTADMANISYAQTSSSPVPSPLPEDAVTITSPTDGQQVPVGQDLTVTGTSIAKPGSGCKISVNLNRILPLQDATATGPGGADDYSQWSITLSSKYASIQEGQNRIAARISCGSDPSLRQFTHVNVTGVPP